MLKPSVVTARLASAGAQDPLGCALAALVGAAALARRRFIISRISASRLAMRVSAATSATADEEFVDRSVERAGLVYTPISKFSFVSKDSAAESRARTISTSKSLAAGSLLGDPPNSFLDARIGFSICGTTYVMIE
jgi:hypothetical protein